ncbi:hypothetical protein KIW84_044026 [Lathyrus oleraceus]|uniref:Uncharacterized protein n=1 Tax=Pisum sativum TaxID=3888 RepID=A0A9D4XH32_PEA|nr:hypothetical protein KIW84_044026 [Pisum sativum]
MVINGFMVYGAIDIANGEGAINISEDEIEMEIQIVTGGIEVWVDHECAQEMFRKKLWGGNFRVDYKRKASLTWFFDYFSIVYKEELYPIQVLSRYLSPSNKVGMQEIECEVEGSVKQ